MNLLLANIFHPVINDEFCVECNQVHSNEWLGARRFVSLHRCRVFSSESIMFSSTKLNDFDNALKKGVKRCIYACIRVYVCMRTCVLRV